MTEHGRSDASASSGHSRAEPEEVSALRASVPNAVPCIACGRQLDDALKGIADNQPYAGTSFVTGGHYGSTTFDPMDGSRLEINICDPCLRRAADQRIVIHHSNMGRVTRWLGDRQCG